MALAASLFLRQTQSLVMTPQLMQSIQLLQMTHLELTHFIEQEVEKNPLLEVVANDDMPREIEAIADVERGLGRLQALDPPGVFARTLSDCLASQLRVRARREAVR